MHEEHGNQSPPGAEAPERLELGRRGFLKAAGFSLAGALATGCSRSPIDRAIPFLVQPEEVVPGRALWYASTCGACTAGCGVLAKSRDGRPIKLEGNPQHPVSAGGLCAAGQASILGPYDSHRLPSPLLAGEPTSWEEVDAEVRRWLDDLAARGGRVRLLTETIHSPTERAWVDRLIARFPQGRHVTYDPLSSSALREAHRRTHGTALTPRYRLDRAEVIAAFDADFLGTWISPVEHTAGYRAGRSLEGDPPRLSFHLQIEDRLSLTGSNADRRIVATPRERATLLSSLVRLLAGHANVDLGVAASAGEPLEQASAMEDLAERLWQARGRSLVVCGSQQVDEQVLVALANQLLGNEGVTLDLERPSLQRQGDDPKLAELLDELQGGNVDALLVRGVNPVYDLPQGSLVAEALATLPLVISFASHRDETAALATAVCPEPHFLESWRDGEPVAGIVSVTQPALRPLGKTRGFAASLATWLGDGLRETGTELDLLRRTWRDAVYPRHAAVDSLPAVEGGFEAFWGRSVHDGFATVKPAAVALSPFSRDAAATALAAVEERPKEADPKSFALVLYPTVALLDGRHAGNPWLQELPDPVTKVVWDNHASLSPHAAEELGLQEGDGIRLQATGDGEPSLELPVHVQPGQHDRVVAVALGYGSEATRRFAGIGPRWISGKETVSEDGLVGRNGAPLVVSGDGQRLGHREGIHLQPTGTRHALASTQDHHTLEMPPSLTPASGVERPIVQETVLEAYAADRGAGAPHGHLPGGDLWPAHPYPGHHWAMAIDLNACTGCSACVIACQVENNVPVVGKDEVARHREMSWLRIDRYYREDGDDVDVAHQPMLCHHCDNAPCETVCPVLATVHSSEGLNQQVYNRCVGTRYCANNCPFKVRRFNWFNYRRDDTVANLVLNPDVVVRSRGVMEKCSFCVQRIQEAKQVARMESRAVADGDTRTACQQSCPAQAITFGDLSDPQSQVAQATEDPRHYLLLEELNVRPSVGYLRRVRNRPKQEPGQEETHHG